MTVLFYTNAGRDDSLLDNFANVQVGDMDYCEFYDSSATPIGACTVDWGDGTVVTDPGSSYIVFLTHNYAAVGNYTLVATWPGGSRTVVQHISPVSPHLTATTSNGMVGVAVNTQMYGDYMASNVFNVDWGDGTTYSESSDYGLSLDHAWGAPGDYTITITLTNSRGTITNTYPVNIVPPPPGMTIDDAVEISGASGSQVMGPYQGLPRLVDTWPEWDFDTDLAQGGNFYLWARWTAPTTGMLLLNLVTDPIDEPTPWMVAYRASDMLAINETEGPGVEPYNLGLLGVPVEADVEYLFLVGHDELTDNTALLKWSYARNTVSGPCFFVPYGFHSDELADAVQISDPTKTQTVAWAGGGYSNYINTAYGNGKDRLYLSPDRLDYQPGALTHGFGVVAGGKWISEVPSIYFSDGLYPDSQATQRGAYPVGFPGTDDVLITGGAFFYDDDFEFRRVAPDGSVVASWSRPPNMPDDSGHPADTAPALDPAGGPDTWLYTPRFQGGEFIDSHGDLWIQANPRLFHWNGSSWVNVSASSDFIIMSIHFNGDGTSTLTPHSAGPLTAHCDRIYAFVQIGNEWLVSFNSNTYQYNGGMWIRRYSSSWTILEEFEFRPFPVVLHGSTGNDADSLPPYNYGEFYAQGYMAVVPGDNDHFYMTNNAWEDVADISWSFIFKIPRLDSGGNRFAAMRTPWAAWKSNGGEIYNIVYGEMPLIAPSRWVLGALAWGGNPPPVHLGPVLNLNATIATAPVEPGWRDWGWDPPATGVAIAYTSRVWEVHYLGGDPDDWNNYDLVGADGGGYLASYYGPPSSFDPITPHNLATSETGHTGEGTFQDSITLSPTSFGGVDRTVVMEVFPHSDDEIGNVQRTVSRIAVVPADPVNVTYVGGQALVSSTPVLDATFVAAQALVGSTVTVDTTYLGAQVLILGGM